MALTPEQIAYLANEKMVAEARVGVYTDWLSLPENRQLKTVLEIASTATKWIGPEQTRLKLIAENAESKVEREARQFQSWYVEKYLTRAEEVAKTRLRYLGAIETHARILDERKRCENDINHWFKYYAWGYDPRARTALAVVPFDLFPQQKRMIKWLNDLVFFQRSSGIIEKSRDEGATEAIVRWGLYHWLFSAGFSMLLSTRKEDEVDSKKNQNTLFERIRFQIRLLPRWLLPEDFDLTKGMLPAMKLANPNGNTLIGEAPVENMGRGGRVTCAMLDEFAFYPYSGYSQFRSLSQTTDSIIMPSSVAGRLNQYADIAFDGVTSKFVLDWRDNPFKDKRWYDALPYGYISPKMSRTTIAQEVDRNYDAAQPGKVWYAPEPHVFITREEFLAPFINAKMGHKFLDDTGAFKIPDDWRVIRTHDFGKSEGHDWGYLLGAQPRGNYPLADTHFIFVARNLEPVGLKIEQAVGLWSEYEREIGLRDRQGKWLHRPYMSYNSHEQKDLRRVLMETYAESWVPWQTDYETGISEIEDWWTLIDKTLPNPHRPDLEGRARLVFVAPDDEYELAFNEQLNQHFVTTSKSEDGFLTARKQIGAYHYPEWELGKSVKKMRPAKEFDDIVDCLRGYAVSWNRSPEEITPGEEMRRRINEKVSFNIDSLDHLTPEQSISRQMARLFVIKDMKKEGQEVDQWGNAVEYDPDDYDMDDFDYDDMSEGW